jgi:hypothetical protein
LNGVFTVAHKPSESENEDDIFSAEPIDGSRPALPPEPTPPKLEPPTLPPPAGERNPGRSYSTDDAMDSPTLPIYPDGPIEPSPTVGTPVPPSTPAAKNDAVATTAMVVGVVSVPAALCGPIFGVIIGLAAIILSVIGKNRIAESGAPGAGAVKAALYLGLAAIVISVVTFIIWVIVILPGSETS